MREQVNQTNCKIMGRHLLKEGVCFLEFSGGFVEFEFTGTELSAEIKTDYAEEEILRGYIGIFVNGEYVRKIALEKPHAVYKIVNFNVWTTAVVRIVRFSEMNFGKVAITALEHDGKILPTPEKSRKIEFIGNSITCGYGVEAETAETSFSTSTENPAKAYAMLTAEAMNADYHIVSWSGNGIVTHWVPPEVETPDESYPLIPDVYRNINAGSFAFEGEKEPEAFDFESFQPDLVVVNIGTNDASYTRNKELRVQDFGERFRSFLEYVRAMRPKAYIIACLGVMNGDLCMEEAAQVAKLAETDGKIFFLSQPEQLVEDGRGADWHPSEITHRKMMEQLVTFIREKGIWK